MKDFWQNLPKPIFALAPMEDVTDSVFRQIVAACAPPDVYFTEFTSADGMNSLGRNRILHRFQYTQVERPIIAQIWGLVPENFYKAAKDLVEWGFDGVDINMGCPERKVTRSGACAALIKNKSLTTEIITATQEGAGSASRRIPVSVKTRIGYASIQTEDWIGFLLGHSLDALTIHGRTAKEMSVPPPHWDEVAKAVTLRNQISPRTIILGNGDVRDREDGLAKCREYGLDGVMIGRGIFQNLWAFSSVIPLETGIQGNKNTGSRVKPGMTNEGSHQSLSNKSLPEMLALLRKHMHLFTSTWGDKKNFLVLRRFFKIYVSGFPGASELRDKLMKTKTSEEVEALLRENVVG